MKKADANGPIIETLTLEELCRFCGTDSTWVVELVEQGVLIPHVRDRDEWAFEAIAVARARKARRLQRDFAANAAGIALILDLLDERDVLRRTLAMVKRP